MPRKYQHHATAPAVEEEFIEIYRRLDPLVAGAARGVTRSTGDGIIRHTAVKVELDIIPHVPAEKTFDMLAVSVPFVVFDWGVSVIAHSGPLVNYDLAAMGSTLKLTGNLDGTRDVLVDRPVAELGPVGGGDYKHAGPADGRAIGVPIIQSSSAGTVVMRLRASYGSTGNVTVLCHKVHSWITYAMLTDTDVLYRKGC